MMPIADDAMQAEPPHDRAALESVLEPLMRLAELHEHGKENYGRKVTAQLLDAFLKTEERFAHQHDSTDQEVIDAMRTVQVQPSTVKQTLPFDDACTSWTSAYPEVTRSH